MPYISQEDRDYLDGEFGDLIEHLANLITNVPSGKTGGALNYVICRLAMNSQPADGYTDLSNMIGHVESAAKEMRRRLLDPYEDECIEKNGDLDEFRKT